MRTSLIILAGLLLCGCNRSPTTSLPAFKRPAYVPERFRSDVALLIASHRFNDAVIYVAGADPARQADDDRMGFMAVAWDAILLPGAERNQYDPQRDWCFPGTQDAIEHLGWQSAAQAFANRYNTRRLSEKQTKN